MAGTEGAVPTAEEAVNKETILGITYHERQLVRESWLPVREDLSGTGLLMFTMHLQRVVAIVDLWQAWMNILLDHTILQKSFFEDYPGHQKYFPFKQTLTKENIGKDPMVKLHGLRVMKEITNYVDMLDQPEPLLEALRKNAQNHRKREIAKSTYDDLRTTILKLLNRELSNIFTDKTNAAWDKVLKIVFQTITDISSEK